MLDLADLPAPKQDRKRRATTEAAGERTTPPPPERPDVYGLSALFDNNPYAVPAAAAAQPYAEAAAPPPYAEAAALQPYAEAASAPYSDASAYDGAASLLAAAAMSEAASAKASGVFERANCVTAADRERVEAFLRNDYDAARTDTVQVVLNEERRSVEGKEGVVRVEQIVYEMNFASGSGRRLKRQREVAHKQ